MLALQNQVKIKGAAARLLVRFHSVVARLDSTKPTRYRWVAPREMDRLGDYGIRVRDEYVGTGATGQIFTAMDDEYGHEVAIKMVRGIYTKPRVAQNLWREVCMNRSSMRIY